MTRDEAIKKFRAIFKADPASLVEYQASGTFQAVHAAEDAARASGMRVGSMCRDEPIGLAPDAECSYIAKWWNIDSNDKMRLSGVLLSSDFREGNVWIAMR